MRELVCVTPLLVVACASPGAPVRQPPEDVAAAAPDGASTSASSSTDASAAHIDAGPAADAALPREAGAVADARATAGDAAATPRPAAFVHPGLLHSAADFERMKTRVASGGEPWTAGWQRLVANPHASAKWTPRPVPVVYRGFDGTHPENYTLLYNDAAAAYALALRWKISGDASYADAAVKILDAWSGTLTQIAGTSDKFLASGIYGYEIANAAEIIRGYEGWPAAGFARFRQMMLDVFYAMNHAFLLRHNGACVTHYWANWDLANMASMLAIGVLADDRAIYAEAVDYFKNGAGNGAIGKAVYVVHPGNLGQWQESGRDQGHNTLGIALMGAFAEMAWKQGDDLYGYADNRFLAGAEYVASYNLGNDVPYTPYRNCDPSVNQAAISSASRGAIRPGWELVYNHYVVRRGLSAANVAAFAAKVRPEGGGGNYGPNSGGYDQLGYGTLTATLDR
jgi:hypothetical protein